MKLATISVVPFFQIRRSKMKLVKRERKTETEKRQRETERAIIPIMLDFFD